MAKGDAVDRSGIVARGYSMPLTQEEQEGIWRILRACDADFLPPLSHRTSSCQKDLAPGAASLSQEGPRQYFQELIRQEFLLFMDERSLQGFLSYRPHWTGEGPLAGDSLYITTVCVPKELRGRGIATELYCALEQKESSPGEPCAITIRTWSTNLAQIALLEKLGYHAALRIQDDRGPGIDTIYFRKMLED